MPPNGSQYYLASQDSFASTGPMCKKGQNFTEFALEAMENYIRGIKFAEKVEQSFGIWEGNEHKELKNGTEKYVRSMRKGRKL